MSKLTRTQEHPFQDMSDDEKPAISVESINTDKTEKFDTEDKIM